METFDKDLHNHLNIEDVVCPFCEGTGLNDEEDYCRICYGVGILSNDNVDYLEFLEYKKIK